MQIAAKPSVLRFHLANTATTTNSTFSQITLILFVLLSTREEAAI